MFTLQEAFTEYLSGVVFTGSDSKYNELTVSEFWLRLDKHTHKPEISFACTLKPGDTEEPCGHEIRIKLDYEDRKRDIIVECGDSITNTPEADLIASRIDWILEAYGLTREQIVCQAFQNDTRLKFDQRTNIFCNICHNFLTQNGASVAELKTCLRQEQKVFDDLMIPTAPISYCEELLNEALKQDLPLSLLKTDIDPTPLCGEPPETLSEIFERRLHQTVFENSSGRLQITGIEPSIVEEGAERKPAVSFNVKIYNNERVEDLFRTTVPLDRNTYAGVYDDPQETIEENVDVILSAYGFKRSDIAAAVTAGCEEFTDIEQDLYDAMCKYVKDGTVTMFDDADVEYLWTSLHGSLVMAFGEDKPPLHIRTVQKTGFEPDLGTIYSVTVGKGKTAVFDNPVPSQELTDLHRVVLEEFFEQEAHPEVLSDLAGHNRYALPKALFEKAQETASQRIREAEREERRAQYRAGRR